MSTIRDEFMESESASFLHGEPKVSTSQEDSNHSARRHHVARWNRLSTPVTIPRFLVYMITLFMVVIFVTLMAVLVSLSTVRDHKDMHPSESMFGEVPKTTVVFHPDQTYDVDPFGPDMLESPWNNLAPPGKGHVRIEDPAALGLSGGFPLNDGKGESESGAEEYTVSMFHQLHCLAAIKSKMSRLLDWYHDENDKEYLSFVLSQENMADDHIYHCFDYLRQAITCSGDTTLEKARTGDDGKPVRGVDGWGVGHECRHYDTIYALTAAHRSRNITGID
ncbi:hypothetical protein B0H63DRAFT_181422 [Podospora didyma]|uniref:Oxidase ustYa n=1 Tax=Podospora didyma TaxID=330526 RepID=A0AAE0NPG0_9PEZI|nr:hypothetical protein B0H63DRAFT_181422 [Podospora didyma]